jgi:hypothetical protein
MKYTIRQSDIEGMGIFATADIPLDEIIGIWTTTIWTPDGRCMFQDGMEVPWYETADLGRYCNDSRTPNSTAILVNGEFMLYSNGILIDDEITVDYNIFLDHSKYVLGNPNI